MRMSRHVVALIVSCLLLFTGAVLASPVTLNTYAVSPPQLPSQFYAPYQDMTLGKPSLKSIEESTGQKYFTLAFVVSHNGCNASWGASTPTLTSDISYIRGKGGDVIVSFGGQAGKELALACTSVSSLQAQYQHIIDTYHLTHLDFDIEGGTEGDAQSYTRRNIALAALQKANKGLTIDFTLPSDPTGPTSADMGLLKNAKAKGVNFSIVNLMTMDYNGPDSHMGEDAINAANNLYLQLGKLYTTKTSSQLWSMVGLTNMIGQNDTLKEIFTLNDATSVLSFARLKHIGELSIWEASRDSGSCPGNTSDQNTCSGLSQSTNAFTNVFKAFTN
jgi:hypothetical protein